GKNLHLTIEPERVKQLQNAAARQKRWKGLTLDRGEEEHVRSHFMTLPHAHFPYAQCGLGDGEPEQGRGCGWKRKRRQVDGRFTVVLAELVGNGFIGERDTRERHSP